MADLIDLATYKALMAVDPTDTRDDVQVAALLPGVSRAIRTYTGRQFDVTNSVATARSFQYDGSGFLDIDDCTMVTLVSTDAGVPGQSWDLTTYEWTAMPQGGTEVFYYLLIHGGPMGGSPEMGFERNLDTMVLRPKSPLITVTATWGWPAIPEDVKLATAITVSSMAGGNTAHDEELTGESIEGFSRSWGNKQGGPQALMIPNRARDLLANYAKVFV